VARAQDDAAAAGRDHRHVAVQGVLGGGVVGLEVEAAGHRLEDDTHLGHCQGGAEAAADAAAEGDPLIGAGLAAEPALGAELEGLGVEVLAVVDEEDAHRDCGAGGNAVLAELPGER
jgi:hypothetical protein